MNTPAHAVLNLVALGRKDSAHTVVPILVGGVLPDVPMFAFYFIEKIVLGTPERVIWSTRYYDPVWQGIIDLVHSVPVILILLGAAWWIGSRWFAACFASMALHIPGDFFLHHDDAHRHFFPVTNWRFESPVSYWDSRHYGDRVETLEMLAVVLALGLLIKRYDGRSARAKVGIMAGAYAAHLMFALWMWA